ncbi:hypothetical protein WA158_007846 [Blastocystis sp. Blastoise]
MLSRFVRVPKTTIRSFATYFSKDHEWISYEPGKLAAVGITDFAQNSLGDIVYVELPSVGSAFKQNDRFAIAESVKAASDVYIPASGTVKDINEALVDTPSLVNESPVAKGWFAHLELSNPEELKGLMNETDYKEFCKKAEH